jgi:hypothetical protein
LKAQFADVEFESTGRESRDWKLAEKRIGGRGCLSNADCVCAFNARDSARATALGSQTGHT